MSDRHDGPDEPSSTVPPRMRGDGPRPGLLARATARVRIPLLWGWLALVCIDWLVVDLPAWATLGATVLALALYFVVGAPSAAARTVRFPLDVSALALNSPVDRVPSHGLHAYGQSFALDLVPHPSARPETDRWAPTGLEAAAFPGFGADVVAPVGGVVVTARDQARDHRSRTSIPGFAYLLVEGVVREVTGPNRVLGNHVTIEADDGSYALVAHLQQGSLAVGVGDRVEAGQRIAACGNSGNSTEPHVHVQVMDRRHPAIAAGLPFVFGPTGFVPANGEVAGPDGVEEG